MARKQAEAAAQGPPRKVRYRVMKQAFVNGSIVEPGTAARPSYVIADEGLGDEALELAPGTEAEPAAAGELLAGDR